MQTLETTNNSIKEVAKNGLKLGITYPEINKLPNCNKINFLNKENEMMNEIINK